MTTSQIVKQQLLCLKPVMAIVFGLLISSQLMAGESEREQAKRIHDRLIGTLPTAAMLSAMETEILNNSAFDAALLAIDGNGGVTANPGFYNTTLKNWASPWTNRDQDPFFDLNDYSALVIGLIRDDEDFRQLLYGNILYTSNADGYSTTNNDAYVALEQSGADLSDDVNVLVRTTQSSVNGLPASAAAGVFTTRAAARAFFIDGTNRAMLRFTLLNQLCMDMEDLKDGTRPSGRIRQDISRSPGGDSRLFINNCLECHSGMDPLAQAFAFYQYQYPANNVEGGQLIYTDGVVQPKYFNNALNFEHGYVTPDDRWTNYWVLGSNADKVGWRDDISVDTSPYPEANGAATLGRELADTDAFAACQIKKAFKVACLREPDASDDSLFDTANPASLIRGFRAGGNMKNVFAELASYCASGL
jgi:hypothetical protein